MTEQAGVGATGVHTRRATLSTQYSAAVDADRVLAEALAAAHAATLDGVSRLDAIAAEIDRAVATPERFALDTAWGAREFQRFLLAKQREIAAVVSHAHQLDGAQRLVVQSLQVHYRLPVGPA